MYCSHKLIWMKSKTLHHYICKKSAYYYPLNEFQELYKLVHIFDCEQGRIEEYEIRLAVLS